MTKEKINTSQSLEDNSNVPNERPNKEQPEKLELSQFESALSELESLVSRMEAGNQSLEESIKDFEKGMQLSKQCQFSIEEAEQRVNQLIAKHGDYSPEPFYKNSNDEQ